MNPAPLAPSAVQLVADGDRARQFGVPVAMSTEQVKTEVVDRFVFAAKQAFEAGRVGFDALRLKQYRARKPSSSSFTDLNFALGSCCSEHSYEAKR